MVEEFEQENSGWSLTEIINILVNFNIYAPSQIGLSTFINLPKYIQDKKAVINIKLIILILFSRQSCLNYIQ